MGEKFGQRDSISDRVPAIVSCAKSTPRVRQEITNKPTGEQSGYRDVICIASDIESRLSIALHFCAKLDSIKQIINYLF